MMNYRSVVSALVATTFVVAVPLAAIAEDGKCPSTIQTVIKAKPEVVYCAILKLRDESKETVKEVSREGQHSCVLEETFEGLPVIGTAKCTYKEVYVPNKKIEYSMLKSEKFRAFEGTWQLSPSEDGESTNLSLTSFVDVDLPVPFAKQLTKMTTMRGVKRRIKLVRDMCEKQALSAKPSARPVH
ncbi:MAG: SRPBCC family protein [Candidatus Melainabacteria bacterium]|nr:SRPBCC family protein [Candidatus Melainabacteria bacterium]